MARGLVAGFLAGVVLTLILAGSTAYYVYTQVQQRLSPEGTQQAVETRLVSLLGQGAKVGGAQVTFPNLITLSNVSIANATGTVFSVEKIEAAAEGGVAGLQQGHFVEVVLTHPVITLERKHGRWNVRDLIDPLLARASAIASASPALPSATTTTTKHGIPLRMVQLKGLNLTIAVEIQPPQRFEIETLLCSRENKESPWSLHCQGTQIHLNSAAEEFPFGELANSIQDLVPSHKEEPAIPPSEKHPWLAGVILENTSLEITYPQQRIILEGISFQADELFEVLKLQTGSLEKKNVSPGV